MPFKNGWVPQFADEPASSAAQESSPFQSGWTPEFDTPAASPMAALVAAPAPAQQATSPFQGRITPLLPQGANTFGDFVAGAREGLTGEAAAIAQLWGSPWAKRVIEEQKAQHDAQSGGKVLGRAAAEVAPFLLGAGIPSLLGRAGIATATRAPTIARALGAAAKAGESLVGQSALAGGTAALVQPGDMKERLKNAALAAALTMGFGGAGRVVGMGRRALNAMAEPYTKGGKEAILGRLINSVSGAPEARAAAIAKMEAPYEGVPGFAPTAADVAENPGISSLQRYVAQAEPAEFSPALQQNRTALAEALRNIGGTAEQRAAAVEARSGASGPLYDAARAATVPMDAEMQQILGTTAGKRAFNTALKTQSNKTLQPVETIRARAMGNETTPGVMSGDLVTDFQKAIADEISSTPMTAVQKAQQRGALSVRGHLNTWLEKNLPDLPRADRAFEQASQPVNQMDIGRQLYEKTIPALGEGSVSPGIYAGRYADALRHADQFARDATHINKPMAEVMSPEQLQTMGDVGKAMESMRNASELGRGYGNSSTYQHLAMQNMAEQAGIPGWLSAVGRTVSLAPFVGPGLRVLTGAGRAAGEAITNSQEQEMRALLARVLMEPKEAARVAKGARAIPLSEREANSPWLSNLAGQLSASIPNVFNR